MCCEVLIVCMLRVWQRQAQDATIRRDADVIRALRAELTTLRALTTDAEEGVRTACAWVAALNNGTGPVDALPQLATASPAGHMDAVSTRGTPLSHACTGGESSNRPAANIPQRSGGNFASPNAPTRSFLEPTSDHATPGVSTSCSMCNELRTQLAQSREELRRHARTQATGLAQVKKQLVDDAEALDAARDEIERLFVLHKQHRQQARNPRGQGRRVPGPPSVDTARMTAAQPAPRATTTTEPVPMNGAASARSGLGRQPAGNTAAALGASTSTAAEAERLALQRELAAELQLLAVEERSQVEELARFAAAERG